MYNILTMCVCVCRKPADLEACLSKAENSWPFLITQAFTTPVATVATESPAVAALTIAGMQGGSFNSDRDLEGDKPISKWRETSMSQEELQQLLQKLPPLNVETMTRVLRTIFLWTSWIHEDVGHAWASFVYNPIHTPGFVPEDGRGIPSPALVYRVAMFRNFVALERHGISLLYHYYHGMPKVEMWVVALLMEDSNGQE